MRRFQQCEVSSPLVSRVLIRLGIHNGPMLKTLVDWKPRIAGSITEYWDGRDEDKVIRVRDHKDFTALITYATLPDVTVITYGNDQESYRDYKLGRGKDRPLKPERPRLPPPPGQLRAIQHPMTGELVFVHYSPGPTNEDSDLLITRNSLATMDPFITQTGIQDYPDISPNGRLYFGPHRITS